MKVDYFSAKKLQFNGAGIHQEKTIKRDASNTYFLVGNVYIFAIVRQICVNFVRIVQALKSSNES